MDRVELNIMVALASFMFSTVARKVYYNVEFEKIRQSGTLLPFRILTCFLLPWMPVFIKAKTTVEKKVK
jgi:hypothetical protein